MNVLLDTHILLWWLKEDKKLSSLHRNTISDSANVCFISAATIWEISIKSKLGKLKITDNYVSELREEGFLELPISWDHAARIKNLPLIHTDPFDRMLIAQAQIEELVLATVDERIKQYDVQVI